MSSNKSKRFVSVFDRLGPGNDEPLSGSGHSRRYSSDKHTSGAEKSARHSYPPLPSTQDPAGSRDRKFREGSSRSRHAPLADHTSLSEEDDRSGERRKTHSESHKSERAGSKSSRAFKSRGSSPDSHGSVESEGEGGSRKKQRDSETQRRLKHGSTSEGPDPSSKKKHHDRKDRSHDSPSTSLTGDGVGKGQGSRKDHQSPHESGGHKRRKEEEHSDSRHADRKRKHDSTSKDPSPHMYKKARVGDPTQHAASPHRDVDKTRSHDLSDPENNRAGLVDHKRRQESNVQPSSRKRPRSQTPDTPSISKRSSDRAVESPSVNKKVELNKGSSREKKISSSYDNEDDPVGQSSVDAIKKLDWNYLSNYTQRQTAKLDQSKPRSALQQFIPGAIFAQVGVSPSLVGLDCYNHIKECVSSYLREKGGSGFVVDDPFNGVAFGSAGVSRIREYQEWREVFPGSVGPCRRALTAAADHTIRRKLRKINQPEYLQSTQPPPSWESQHYPTSVTLYQSLGKKASGKPAYRLQESSIGELLVAR